MPQHEQRRLAAILAADMAGYSRLVGIDEQGTIARQRLLRADVIDPQLDEYGGRIVSTSGDGLLVEFASIVGAVACAADIQRAMATRGTELQ
jgi:adenylate cyclase